MDLAHQALLSRGLDLLILVSSFTSTHVQRIWNDNECGGNEESELNQIYAGRTIIMLKKGMSAQLWGEKDFNLDLDFYAFMNNCSEVYWVTTLHDLTRPIINPILLEIYNLEGLWFRHFYIGQWDSHGKNCLKQRGHHYHVSW